MSDTAPVLLDVTPGELAVVTINRPEKKNAFDRETINKLSEIFDLLAKNTDEVRVVMLRGAGDTFCAGGDLNWMKDAAGYTREQNIEDAEALAGMLYRLFNLPQLTIALVQGAAMGGGSGLVAACDVAIAQSQTKFRFSEVRLGLTPATISPFVIRAIGPKWARALFATAEGFDAKFAHMIGLVQYVVEDANELDDMAEYVARLGFSAAPGAIADAKELVDDVVGHKINHGLMDDLAKRIAHRRASEEGREGLGAFLEKRKPDWAG
ncbi:enoyl-CoA hydratase-related protein [Hyphobacterium sp.]|uniref:enoyl-CoA hydratase-related protein n=1 Tax=Hyphobacterium sp. TaxID=2004662 RepID=UPI003BACBB08